MSRPYLFCHSLVAALICFAAKAEPPGAEDAAGRPDAPLSGEWYLLPEASFMSPPISWPIPGSTQAVLMPVRLSEGNLHPLDPEGTGDIPLTLSELKKQAGQNAGILLDSIETRWVRDENGVIVYAALTGEHPALASVVTAPGFSKRFEDTIGPDAVVVIPNRYKVYIFPRSAPPSGEFSELIFIEYRSGNHPVSREFFDVQDGELSAVGTIR